MEKHITEKNNLKYLKRYNIFGHCDVGFPSLCCEYILLPWSMAGQNNARQEIYSITSTFNDVNISHKEEL